jgi:hypothetical protein
MSDRLLVGTRKGLFQIERRGAGRWDIARSWFLGAPVSMVLAVPGGTRLHAALALGHFGVKMQRSEDGGETWSETPAPAFPTKPADLIDKDPMRGIDVPWSTQLVWALERGAPEELWPILPLKIGNFRPLRRAVAGSLTFLFCNYSPASA